MLVKMHRNRKKYGAMINIDFLENQDSNLKN